MGFNGLIVVHAEHAASINRRRRCLHRYRPTIECLALNACCSAEAAEELADFRRVCCVYGDRDSRYQCRVMSMFV